MSSAKSKGKTAPEKKEKMSPESCKNMEDLAQFISQMKFTKKAFGGVSQLVVA